MGNASKPEINIKPEKIKKILIMNLGGIGDFLLSLPALKALRNYYQDSYIVLLTVPRTVSFAKDSAILDEVLSFELKLHYVFRLLAKLRARRFDMAVNMRTIVSWKSAFKMAVIFYIIQAKYKVGRDTNNRGFFFNIKIPEDDIGDMPEYIYDLKTVEALGINIEHGLPEISICKASVSFVNNFLTINNIKEGDTVIGIHPGAPFVSKRWPLEKFAKVINMLSENNSYAIIITGTQDEVMIAQKLQSLSKPKLIIATGKTSIKQLAALIKRCGVYITGDTGPMHIAAILKIPLVAIFGGGYLTRFDPRNISDKAIVLHKEVDCAPCNKVICKPLKCLEAIQPEEVVEAALKLLSNNCSLAPRS